MSILLTTDLTASSVFPKGKTWTLDEMYALLNCREVALVKTVTGMDMWIDAEALVRDPQPKVNLLATAWYGQEMLLGNALVTEPDEVE